MTEARRILTTHLEVTPRLAELGLKAETLTEAARRGLNAYASAVHTNYPRIFPGLFSWAESIRALGDMLAPSKWTRDEDRGQPLVVNANGEIAITVASGDENTGKLGEDDPRTRSSKGPTTVQAISMNAWLIPEMEQDEKERIGKKSKRRSTWWLLTFRDMDARELRCELSMPIGIDGKGIVRGWLERLILKPISFDGAEFVLPQDDAPSGPQTGQITVEIKRRA